MKLIRWSEPTATPMAPGHETRPQRHFTVRCETTDGFREWPIGGVLWRHRGDRPSIDRPALSVWLDDPTLIGSKSRSTLGTAGRCIYCGAVRFSQEREMLAEEHVITEAFGAAVVLLEASCESCAGYTSAAESKIVTTLFDPARKHLGIKGKPRRSRKNNFRFWAHDGREAYELTLPSQIHPTVLAFPIFQPPSILWGQDIEYDAFEGFWALNVNIVPNNIEEHNLNLFAAATIDLLVFCQMLAKIAHAYAYAKLGGWFRPYHTDFIKRKFGKNDMASDLYRHVGGSTIIEPESDQLHELSLGGETIGGKLYYLVRIRLFANLRGPTYLVIVGRPIASY